MQKWISACIQAIKDSLHSIFGIGSHEFNEDATFTNDLRWRFCERPGCYRIEVTTDPVEHQNPTWLEREAGIRKLRLIESEMRREMSKKDLVKTPKML